MNTAFNVFHIRNTVMLLRNIALRIGKQQKISHLLIDVYYRHACLFTHDMNLRVPAVVLRACGII